MIRLNFYQCTGNVGKDPEIRTVKNGKKVATFNVAVNDGYYDANGNWNDRVYWVRIVAWQKLAEAVENKVKKGVFVYVSGKLVINEFTDKEGNKRTGVDIVASLIQTETKKKEKAEKKEKEQSSEDDSGDDLPF